MISRRLMTWCAAAVVLTPAVVHAQHEKAAAPHADMEVTVSAKHQQNREVGKVGKAGTVGTVGTDGKAGKAGTAGTVGTDENEKAAHETPTRASARTTTASKREPASEERKPSKSSKARTARASRETKGESATEHDTHSGEPVARVTPGSSGKSARTLEITMDRINEQVDAIRATAASKPRPAASPAKPTAAAHRVVKVAAPAGAAEAAPPRMRLSWRTVLDWPADLRSDEETPERADLPRIALSWR